MSIYLIYMVRSDYTFVDIFEPYGKEFFFCCFRQFLLRYVEVQMFKNFFVSSLTLQTDKLGRLSLASRCYLQVRPTRMLNQGNTKGGSITVPLTCLTGLEVAV